jgi:Flp pilus assembly protein TadD
MRRLRALALALLVACSADSVAEKGRVALEAHELAEAETWFRRALAKDAQHPGALAGLGWTYNLAGQRAAALDAFRRCNDVAPEDVECLRGLASLEMAAGRYDAARRRLDEARALDPDDPGVESSAALLLMVTGDVDAAAMRYERLVARRPDTGEYRLGLAEARLRQRRPDEAMRLAQEGAALPDTPVRYVALLWQLYARAAVQASAGLEDPTRCAETAPPIRAWLTAADGALDQAAATGVTLPDLPATRRLVERRRGILGEACPEAPPPLLPSEEPG